MEYEVNQIRHGATPCRLKKNQMQILRILFLVLLLTITLITIHNNQKLIILDYEEWYVVEGDTVSYIAKIFTPVGMDYRVIQEQIIMINGIKNGLIMPGEILLVPIYGLEGDEIGRSQMDKDCS
ncbi:LysM peptidoglycan-binding domain-containing protein [Anaerosolibacter sp.]|uniref:LysM peptidoglycan-binding domain-containing protein n=1 Tax=Anaerosolibacter sp. TaxID=1872527 RepID=UPI0039F13682